MQPRLIRATTTQIHRGTAACSSGTRPPATGRAAPTAALAGVAASCPPGRGPLRRGRGLLPTGTWPSAAGVTTCCPPGCGPPRARPPARRDAALRRRGSASRLDPTPKGRGCTVDAGGGGWERVRDIGGREAGEYVWMWEGGWWIGICFPFKFFIPIRPS